MIVVTGTKRSGTSSWMQLLRAAGLPSIGEAFPSDWNRSLRDANPEGFFESRFRDGINFVTNPDPETGFYLHPSDVRLHAVKIFVPGLTKTDLSFVERVIAGVRDVREYDASVRLLDALDDERDAATPGLPKARHMTPFLEWWHDNYALLADAMTRRYPILAFSYADLVTSPEPVVRRALDFVGGGDAAAAAAAIRPELRRHDRGSLGDPAGLHPSHLPSFRTLFDVLTLGPPDDDAFLDQLGETHLALVDRIEAERDAVRASHDERRLQRERDVRTGA